MLRWPHFLKVLVIGSEIRMIVIVEVDRTGIEILDIRVVFIIVPDIQVDAEKLVLEDLHISLSSFPDPSDRVKLLDLNKMPQRLELSTV